MPKPNLSKRDLIENREKSFNSYAEKNIKKGSKKVKLSVGVGEKVMVFREVKSGKLSSNWADGFVIKKILTRNSVLVTNGKTELRVHKSHLKKDFTE